MLAPCIDNTPSIEPISELLWVQTTVYERAVEAFNENIMSRLARVHEMQLHAGDCDQSNIALRVSSVLLS